jgi:hypothetical protein
MNLSELALHDHLDDAVDRLRRNERLWQEDKVPIDGITNFTSSAAAEYCYLSNTAALLDATRQAREWSGEAARFYWKRIQAGRLRRDIRERGVWNSEVPMFSRALSHALLSRDEALLTEIATDAVEMDDSYLDAFADDYADSPVKFYNMKVEAALVLKDDRLSEFLESLRIHQERIAEEGGFWQLPVAFYQALVNQDTAAAEQALSDLYEYYAEEHSDPSDPEWYVLNIVLAYIILARRRGLDVSIDSPRLSAAFLRDEIPEDDVELDVDLDDLTVCSDVGLFELERDEDGAPVIVGRIYHPGDEPVSAEDLSARAAGRVLSDEWIEAALEEASWRDHYDEELVSDAKSAFEAGSLLRNLVVVQDRTDQYIFDESLGELPIDGVELLKGAGRRD